ncbi:MAG: hypothetical protein HZA36_00320 [Parcubacteria group bacterium]|nr:hypothetical protein [Parcubacteria group bacterium]
MSNETEAEFEYEKRLEREKAKAREKYGDTCTNALGNLEHDAQDYAINELVGLDRYAEIIIARANLYGREDGILLGEDIRVFAHLLAKRLIMYRNCLRVCGVELGKSEQRG